MLSDLYDITIGAFPGGPGFLAWAANNAAGPAVRSVSTAYVVTLGTAGGILATWYLFAPVSTESNIADESAGHTSPLKPKMATRQATPST